LTEFTASKYIKRLDGITLKDLLKLSHPTPKNDAQNALFKSIIDGSLTSSSDWVTIMTSNKYGDTKTKWLNAIPNMAYLPLLKNLAAMERNEIDPALIIPKLTDPQAIRESRILPFEFVKAFENVTSYQYKNAINTAIELSFNNLTLPQGRYLIAIDTSYSMKGDPLNMAAMFGSVLFNKLKQSADIVVFSTTLTKLEPYGLRVMGLYHHIKRIHQSGSTNAYLVYEYANNEKIPYDFIFMLTDMQYSEHYGLDKIETPTGLIININLQGYDNTQSSNMIKNNVVEIAGFSNKIFDYLEVIKDPQGIINKIISKDL
jgi:60 kDa SS-A/Ro ribonucleoprotein